jgi:hypothetical protein
MSERGNRVGVAYSLTVFTPILAGREDALRAHLDALPTGADSPLARLDRLYFSRIQIFDDLVHQGPRQKKRDSLRSAWLVFTSSFDGTLDTYLDELCERLGPDADGWWGHCAGYPGTADRAAFRRYIRAHKCDSDLFAVAYPRATVADVREALALREQLVAFATGAQGLDATALQERFRDVFA